MDTRAAESDTRDGHHALDDGNDASMASRAPVRDRTIRSPRHTDAVHWCVTGHAGSDVTRRSDAGSHETPEEEGHVTVGGGDCCQWQRDVGNFGEFPVGNSFASIVPKNLRPVAVVAPIVVSRPKTQKLDPSTRERSTRGRSSDKRPSISPSRSPSSPSSSSSSSSSSSFSANRDTANLRMTSPRAMMSSSPPEVENGNRKQSVEAEVVEEETERKEVEEEEDPSQKMIRSDSRDPDPENGSPMDGLLPSTPDLDRRLLEASGFFHPHLDRTTAKAKLRHRSAGTFLIRTSSDSRYEYVLSLRTRYGVTSVRLVRNAVGLVLLDCNAAQADRMPAYPSVLALVEGYHRGGGVGGVEVQGQGQGRGQGQCVYLGSSSSGQQDVVLDLVTAFEESPATLAHICRRRINGLIAMTTMMTSPVSRDDVMDSMLEGCVDLPRRQVLKTYLNDYRYRI